MKNKRNPLTRKLIFEISKLETNFFYQIKDNHVLHSVNFKYINKITMFYLIM